MGPHMSRSGNHCCLFRLASFLGGSTVFVQVMRLVICNYTRLGINHQDMQNYQQKRKVNQQIWILLFHHNGTVPHLVRCFSHIYGGFPAIFADTEAWGSKWPATIPQNWSPGVSMSLRFHHPGWLLHHGWQQHQGAPWAFICARRFCITSFNQERTIHFAKA